MHCHPDRAGAATGQAGDPASPRRPSQLQRLLAWTGRAGAGRVQSCPQPGLSRHPNRACVTVALDPDRAGTALPLGLDRPGPWRTRLASPSWRGCWQAGIAAAETGRKKTRNKSKGYLVRSSVRYLVGYVIKYWVWFLFRFQLDFLLNFRLDMMLEKQKNILLDKLRYALRWTCR
jgi:hypothetical protein